MVPGDRVSFLFHRHPLEAVVFEVLRHARLKQGLLVRLILCSLGAAVGLGRLGHNRPRRYTDFGLLYTDECCHRRFVLLSCDLSWRATRYEGRLLLLCAEERALHLLQTFRLAALLGERGLYLGGLGSVLLTLTSVCHSVVHGEEDSLTV